jgi:hypothetical protein
MILFQKRQNNKVNAITVEMPAMNPNNILCADAFLSSTIVATLITMMFSKKI